MAGVPLSAEASCAGVATGESMGMRAWAVR
jgi:hypothetical protein